MHNCTCKRCGKKFQSEHKYSYCSDECKNKQEQLICECCGKTFIGNTIKFKAGHIYCSEKCRAKLRNTNTRRKIIDKRQEHLSEGIEGYDYIVCRLCGLKAVQMNNAHFGMFHPGIDIKKYQEMFPDAPLTCDRFIEQNLKGENNPRSAAKISQEEIRKHSPYCKEFYEARGLDDSVRQEMVRKIADRPIERFAGSMEYYLAQGYTREEAIKIRKERYGFTLEKCISKYGEEEGKRFYLDRQERWINTMYSKDDSCKCKSNISRVSQEFIFDVLGNCCDRTDIFLFGKN